jgi:hypothetical protein
MARKLKIILPSRDPYTELDAQCDFSLGGYCHAVENDHTIINNSGSAPTGERKTNKGNGAFSL